MKRPPVRPELVRARAIFAAEQRANMREGRRLRAITVPSAKAYTRTVKHRGR